MNRTLTISLPDDVYQGLRVRVGDGDVSRFIEGVLRPQVVSSEELEAAYQAMADDEEREREASEWIDADLGETLE
jgi:hypothetical protein